jgi:hypothetical protein
MVRELICLTDMEGNNSLSVCLSSIQHCEGVCEYLIQKYVQTISLLKQSNQVGYFSELESFFNWKNNYDDTPLSLACGYECTTRGEFWVKRYLEYTSELKSSMLSMYYNQLDSFFIVQNKRGFTPLHRAAWRHK